MTINLLKSSALAFSGLLSGALRAQSVNLAPIPLTVDNGVDVHVTAVFSPSMRSG